MKVHLFVPVPAVTCQDAAIVLPIFQIAHYQYLATRIWQLNVRKWTNGVRYWTEMVGWMPSTADYIAPNCFKNFSELALTASVGFMVSDFLKDLIALTLSPFVA